MPSSIIDSEGTEMRIASAVVFSVLAQIHTTNPPSQPTLPSPQERAMEQIHLETQAKEGDAHYQRRAEGRQADVASSIEIDASLEAYSGALKKNRSDVDDRWKYLRSTYFKAEYTEQSDEQKAALYERAMPIADEAIALEREAAGRRASRNARAMEPGELGAALAGDVTAGETFFWASVTWGQWALVHGKLQAARQGAAGRIRDEARTTIAIDPKLEDAGGYRVLGRLHCVSPKVLFVTGWVDREAGVRYLRKAVEIAPENFVNLFFLAEGLREHTDRRDEAVEILTKIIAGTPRLDHLIEDLKIQADARRDLAAWK
jgi:tetratricopeptide (TPR) repeat protein